MITDPGLIAKINEVNSNSAATGISLSRESSEGEIYIAYNAMMDKLYSNSIDRIIQQGYEKIDYNASKEKEKIKEYEK